MANQLHRNDAFVTVHNKRSKLPRTAQDLRKRPAKCIEAGGRFFEHLLRTVTNSLLLCTKWHLNVN
jgi:hypothetical protein